MLHKFRNRKGLQNTHLCMRRLCLNSEWAQNREGKAQWPAKLVYVDSDIESFSGLENMAAFNWEWELNPQEYIAKNAFQYLRLTPGYNNERFMFFENHCYTTLDTSLEPNAIIYLDHLPEVTKEKIPDDLPRFRNIDKPDQ